MRRIVLALVVLGACGGTKIPTHSGYKSEKSKLWAKAKTLNFDEKMEAKAEGDLDYRAMRRAKWYALEIPSNGELSIKLEATPPGDEINDDFDLALEILDPGNRVISKADMEEEDVGELNKTRTLYDLAPGRYLVHIYLQGRLDSADYELRAAFTRTAEAEVKSDFPSQVMFLSALPMVPLNDDTPAGYQKKAVAVVTIKKRNRPQPKEGPPPPPSTSKSARIIGLSVTGGGTQITVGLGTDQGAAPGWKAKIAGVQGSFSVTSCNARTCTAVVSATPDQIKAGGGNVTLSP
jgi:hypothetical protein